MRLNYNKSVVFVVGTDRETHEEIPHLYGGKTGELPMTYLDMPVSDSKITKA